MGDIRRFTKRHKWTDEEVKYLIGAYATEPMPDIVACLSLHQRTIQCKANSLGLLRDRPLKRTPDEVRDAKRKHMAAKRASNLEASREYQRKWREKHADRVNAELRQAVDRRLFWGRALRLRNVTAFDLWKLWHRQRGLCALSGRKLDRTAEIDHRLPKVRGGNDQIGNLQWVTKGANRAKRDLTDAEFLALCRDCAEWIGDRLAEVETWPATSPTTAA